MNSRIFYKLVEWAFLPLIALGLFFFFRGHNSPGGGFIAGLVLSASFVLLGFGRGYRVVQKGLVFTPLTWIVLGLSLSLFMGMISVVVGESFLTGLWPFRGVSMMSNLGTPLLFDLGVVFVVVGMVLQCFLQFLGEDE